MSYRAAAIDREYRLKQYYQNKKKKQSCSKDCEECKYNKVCIDSEV